MLNITVVVYLISWYSYNTKWNLCSWSEYFFHSALFPDVVNCMQTDNLELKKLVYLYLMNYAKSQPDMAIMAVNTFVKVTWLFYFLCTSFILSEHILMRFAQANCFLKNPFAFRCKNKVNKCCFYPLYCNVEVLNLEKAKGQWRRYC